MILPLWLLFAARLLLGLSLGAWFAYTLIAVWAARQWAASRPSLDPNWTPGVTILKPVRGVDAEAYANFASFCALDYPLDRLQIVFGALDPADPALEMARELASDYPECNIDVVEAGPESLRGHNLKVCNLLAMLPFARHDLLVLCDSDMRVQPDYLRRIVAPFQQNSEHAGVGRWALGVREVPLQRQPEAGTGPVPPNAQRLTPNADLPVGLVTCPYRGFRPQSLPALLEALGIGADFIPSAFVSRALEGVSFAFGSTIVLPKSVLAELGGFETLLDELADDFRLGDGVRRAGHRVVLSDYVVDDVLGRVPFGSMWARRLRWARTVRSCRPAGYAGAGITYGTALALLFALTMGTNPIGWVALIGVVMLRCASAVLIAVTCTGDTNLIRYWPLLPLSDLCSFALYVASYCGNGIVWRGEHFRLLPGGRLARYKDSSP